MIKFDKPKTFMEVFMEGHIVHPDQRLYITENPVDSKVSTMDRDKDGYKASQFEIYDPTLVYGVQTYGEYLKQKVILDNIRYGWSNPAGSFVGSLGVVTPKETVIKIINNP